MIDAGTKKPLHIKTYPNAGALLTVPVDQLEHVRERLNRHSIRNWVETQVISIDDGPEIAFVNFDRREDPARIQAILDGAE